MVINGKLLDTGNLFIDTFKMVNNQEWKLVRSYIEAGVPIDHINGFKTR